MQKKGSFYVFQYQHVIPANFCHIKCVFSTLQLFIKICFLFLLGPWGVHVLS